LSDRKRRQVKLLTQKSILALAVFSCILAVQARSQAPRPVPVTVSLDPAGDQVQPAAAIDSAGRMIVAWRDSSQIGERILIQGFGPLGGRLAPVETANFNNFRGAAHPAMTMNFSGSVVVAWDQSAGSNTVYFKGYNRLGQPRTGVPLPRAELRVITGSLPAAAMDSAGNLILVWQDRREGDTDIFGNWYSSADTLGLLNNDSARFAWVGNVRVNSTSEGEQSSPAVAVDRKGRFLVTWRDSRPDSVGIFCRAFDVGGAPVAEFRLPSGEPTSISELSAPVAAASELTSDTSYFLVSWVQTDSPDSGKVYLARLGFYRWRIPAEIGLDSSLTVVRDGAGVHAARPSLSSNESGDIVLVWGENDGAVDMVMGVSFKNEEGVPAGVVPLTDAGPGFGTPAACPVTAVRRDGAFVVVWEDNSAVDVDLKMQSYNRLGVVEDPLYISPINESEAASGAAALLARPDGGYALFWEQETPEGFSIRTADFDLAGRPLGVAQALSETAWDQRRPVTGRNSRGDYLVAWQERNGSDYRLRAMLFGPDGAIVKEVFSLEQSTVSHLAGAAISVGEHGGSYAVWERWAPSKSAPDLVLARLDSAGNSIGAPAVVVSSATGGGRLASVAAAPDASHMVVWRQGAASGNNAHVRARFYNPQGQTVSSGIRISRDILEYLGATGRPVVANSPVTGSFLVLWQEFFSDRQRLYYRMFDSSGDSLELGGGLYRRQMGSTEKGGSDEISQSSPAVATDSSGSFTVLWVETVSGGDSRLAGVTIDSLGLAQGTPFRVPGVDMASLPAVNILAPGRVAVAWQDTVGSRRRLLALEIDFHSVVGSVVLASSSTETSPVFVHIEGNVNDSVQVSSGGNFSFSTLVGGEYRIWLTRNGQRLSSLRSTFTLGRNDSPVVNLGVVAELSSNPGPQLPLAGGVYLHPNVPNPFNPSTTIAFRLDDRQEPVPVLLAVYDLRGRLVKTLMDKELAGGAYSLVWDGSDEVGRKMSSGVYFLRLRAGAGSMVRKMILLK